MSWFSLAGDLISAGASLFGGARSASESRDIARESREQSDYWNRISLAETQRRSREDDWRFRNLIRTRVADATAAGLHPLYALGASGGAPAGGSPSFMLGQSQSGSYLGPGIAAAGRAIGRAVSRGGRQRIDPLTEANVSLIREQTRGQRIQNDILLDQAAHAARKRVEQRAVHTGLGRAGPTDTPPLPGHSPAKAEQLDKGLFFGGSHLPMLPGYSSGSTWGEYFGEPGEWLGGAGTMAKHLPSWMSLGFRRRRDLADQVARIIGGKAYRRMSEGHKRSLARKVLNWLRK